jgi:hypothetical protein
MTPRLAMTPRLTRIDEDGEPTGEPFPRPDRPPKPVPIPEGASERFGAMLEARSRWLEAIDNWHKGNEEATAKRFGNAEFYFEESQKAVVRYFEKFYTSWSIKQLAFSIVPGAPTAEKVRAVVTVLFDAKDSLPALWGKVRRRREEELQAPDWGGFSPAAKDLLRVPRVETESADQSKNRQESLDYFALILATVFIPLARAEMEPHGAEF